MCNAKISQGQLTHCYIQEFTFNEEMVYIDDMDAIFIEPLKVAALIDKNSAEEDDN